MAYNQLWVYANYSEDGTRAVYLSDDDFLYPGTDHNGLKDIYVVDLKDGLAPADPRTHRFLASVDSNENQHFGNFIGAPSLSPDGTKVAFASDATFGDANDLGYADVFVRDLVAGTTTRISTNSDGSHLIFAYDLYIGYGVNNPVFSPDGKSVMFNARVSDYDFSQVFLKNLETGKLTVVSSTAPSEFYPDGVESDYTSEKASFSYDGKLVIFESSAGNLDDSNEGYGKADIYIKHLQSGEIELISRASGVDGEIGNEASSRGVINAGTYGGLTADNKQALFLSASTNLVADDQNGETQDIFIRNLETDTTTLVNVTWDGKQANSDIHDAKISPDGTKIVFTTYATNIIKGDVNGNGHVYLLDLDTGKVKRLSDEIGTKPGEYSTFGHFSPDGGVVIWQTMVQNHDDEENYTEQYYTYVIPGAIKGNDKDNTKPGTARPDKILGLGGNDKLVGLGASDTLDGGTGKDTMKGGEGNDFYIVDNANDVVDEQPEGSDGKDTVKSSVAFSLGGGQVKGKVENLTLTGKADIDGTGNKLDNIIIGNKGKNSLEGGDGDDTIRGGAGKDKIDGGGGKDTADFSDVGKGIVVKLDGSKSATVTVGGSAQDIVKNIESVIGSASDDKLTGDGKANVLAGGKGKDVLAGGSGKDKFLFDTALKAANVDTIKDFKHDADRIQLSEDIFYAIGKSLTATEFVNGKAAADLDDRIIYDKKSGKLFFDSDGNKDGGNEQQLFAILDSKPTLDAGDFAIV